ncbi:MAG: ABC transporter substrate-binding protein [Nitriliruptoraceae bacterium]
MRARWAAVATLALLLMACGAGGDAAVDGSGTPTPSPPDGPDDAHIPDTGTLVAAIGGDPDHLDPHTATSAFAFAVLENVYDTLVQPGADLTMEPALAESWDVSDDRLTWTFRLRAGVVFHDGTGLTAADVVASLEHVVAEGANGWRLDMVDTFTAVDDLTVEVALNRVAPNLLEHLGAFRGMAIAPARAIEAGVLADDPVGTGPFALASRMPGDRIVVDRFDDHWGGAAALDAVEFRVIADQTEKVAQLQAGEVDWIDTVAPEQIAVLEASDDVVVGQVAGSDHQHLALNNRRAPFDNVRVRQAIAYAIDIVAVTEAARLDAGTPNETAIPPSSTWYHEYTRFGHDPDRARRLLEDAGVRNLTIDLMVSSDFPETITAALGTRGSAR